MPSESTQHDRNFDDLAERFSRNIYGGLKGRIRLAVLARDFAEFLPIAPYVPLTPDKTLNILDAGGGQGQFSVPLAAAGHSLVLCDISANMLALARQRVDELQAGARVQLLKCPAQEVAAQLADTAPLFDLVICHAVIEWVVAPFELLDSLLAQLRPGGHLSLIFYNKHALVYKNLLRTNYKKVKSEDYRAFRGSLTPINPLTPEALLEYAQSRELELQCHSGIRVFYDYILDPEQRQREPDSVLELEQKMSRQQPYRDLGRYIHLLLRKKPDES
ncbi:methyltransferase domain-containing protein [Gilvimarinus polysaccharolyticus]|uniref:methyltransferase domain-containing protein n=1 Tax=Gilvimarinus polysaccharolyticus TaxID=863921 RepID=UPI0006732A64|nr:methyltransferase domain-containing protein [Gilvimarinus polysaccharolyticus]